MTKLDLTKPVQTRDGRPAKIDRTDLKNEKPIAGVVTNNDGCEYVTQWFSDGRFFKTSESALDIINVPPKPVKYYTHVYLVDTSLIAGDICVDDGPRESPAQNIGWKFIKTIEFEVWYLTT